MPAALLPLYLRLLVHWKVLQESFRLVDSTVLLAIANNYFKAVFSLCRPNALVKGTTDNNYFSISGFVKGQAVAGSLLLCQGSWG